MRNTPEFPTYITCEGSCSSRFRKKKLEQMKKLSIRNVTAKREDIKHFYGYNQKMF